MKLVKISKLENKEEILKWLTKSLLESETTHSPLREASYRPDETFYVLKVDDVFVPAYIKRIGTEVEVLWVHPEHRRKGYASFMVKTLGIRYAFIAATSFPFWRAAGFTKIGGENSQIMKLL